MSVWGMGARMNTTKKADSLLCDWCPEGADESHSSVTTRAFP